MNGISQKHANVYEEAYSFLKSAIPKDFVSPKIAVICGSGLGDFADTLTNTTSIKDCFAHMIWYIIYRIFMKTQLL